MRSPWFFECRWDNVLMRKEKINERQPALFGGSIGVREQEETGGSRYGDGRTVFRFDLDA
jgi:hypothetical protein